MREGVVGILRRGRCLLCIQRGADVPFPGRWGPLSGKVESGESFEDAVVREVAEEVGYRVEPIAKLWDSISENGEFRLHWWDARIAGGELRPNPREVAEVRWVTPSEYRELPNVFAADQFFFDEIWPKLIDAD